MLSILLIYGHTDICKDKRLTRFPPVFFDFLDSCIDTRFEVGAFPNVGSGGSQVTQRPLKFVSEKVVFRQCLKRLRPLIAFSFNTG